MKEYMRWHKLKEYKCPRSGCGGPLREGSKLSKDDTNYFHYCPACNFRIYNSKLESIAVLKHKPLEPPKFIQELRNREALNNT